MAYEFDPKHPGRPTHEDFAALSAIVIAQDAAASNGMSFDALLADICDAKSLIYMADQRVMRATAALAPKPGVTLAALLATVYLDAFRTGVIFGHGRETVKDVATPEVS